MQPIKVHIIEKLTTAEMFFLQKSIELLNKDSIDTYRLRINNPKTLLKEISQVIKLIEQKSVKEHYGHELFKEALSLFNEEKELQYLSINKNYLMKVLGDNLFDKIYYVSNVLVKDNSNYATILYEKIKAEINRLNGLVAFDFKEFNDLNRIVGYFYVELRSLGYSKEYLHKFIRSIFSPRVAIANFDAVYDIVKTLVGRPLEVFSVYIAIKIPSNLDPEKISKADFTYIKYPDLYALAIITNRAFKQFALKYENWTFFKLEFSCNDFLSAGYIARSILQKKLDLLFMGFSSDEIVVNKTCFVVGANDPKRANNQYFNYQLDGQFKSDITTYESFLNNLDNASSKPLDKISLAKLEAGLRYLRLGSYSEELESKLLNYWIGIEYLFSSADSSGDKVSRLKEYFTKIHSITYGVRIFQYVHKSITNLGIEATLSKFDANSLSYLSAPETITDVNDIVEEFPLFVYRINDLNERFKDFESIKGELNRHQFNLERNLLRIYRLRNEIVHSAAKDKNISDVTSHLRYYLTFIINGFIDFIINNPIDIDEDGKVSINDYFVISKVRMESLMLDKTLNIQKLLEFRNPIEYLT